MGGADPDVQYHLATDASRWCLGGVLFQLKDEPPGTEATDKQKEKAVLPISRQSEQKKTSNR